MLELSRRAEMIMIVMGLVAGSIATLLCIAWTCVLLASSRRHKGRNKHDDEPPILPVTTTTTQQQQSPESTDTALLLAALESMRDDAIPLPPPSNMVPVPCTLSHNPAYSTNLTTANHFARKRKLDALDPIQVAAQQIQEQAGSWKNFWTIHPPRRPRKRAIAPKSARSSSRRALMRQGMDDNDYNQRDMMTRATTRWKVYYATKLRRSVSDETCAGTIVGAASAAGNDNKPRNSVPQHV